MDILGRKTKALEAVITSQRKTIAKQQEAELVLMAKLREMDQLVHQMSQCSSWLGMQPLFADLNNLTTRRMRAESDRIATVLIPEMKKAYLP